MSRTTCAICGMGGYWVAWNEALRGWRCVNHIDTPRAADRGMCMVCGTECTTPEHDAHEPGEPS